MPSHSPAHLAAPPYAVAPAQFPFPGLAALAGKAPVGGRRESVLGCVVAARLAAGTVPPTALEPELLRERADAARAWLTTQPIEQKLRALLQRAINAAGSGNRSAVAAELDALRTGAAEVLDGAAAEELLKLAERVRRG
jgi:hypothetical protein